MAFRLLLICDNNLRVDELKLSVILLRHDKVCIGLRSAVLIPLKIVEIVPSFIMSLNLEQFEATLRIVENLVRPSDAIVMI